MEISIDIDISIKLNHQYLHQHRYFPSLYISTNETDTSWYHIDLSCDITTS